MWNPEMTSSWLAGFTVCLSLIISIGAQNMYVLRQAVRGEYARACVVWCVLADVVLIGAGVAGMAQLLGQHPQVAYWCGVGGALFLLAYGLFACHRMLFAAQSLVLAEAGAVPRSALSVMGALAAITLLNPHVYLDTVVLMGGIGARQVGELKWLFVAGAACASLLWFTTLTVAAQRLRPVFAKPVAWRVLDGVTGGTMLVLAWWVWQGLGA